MHTLWSPCRRNLPSNIAQIERHVPLFLCPALALSSRPHPSNGVRRSQGVCKRNLTRCANLQFTSPTNKLTAAEPLGTGAFTPPKTRTLPTSCPGCGALSQTTSSGDAGFYSTDQNAIKRYLRCSDTKEKEKEDAIFAKALEQADQTLAAQLGLPLDLNSSSSSSEPQVPMCDRCRNLLHHSKGEPIHHPTIDSIEAMIADSPHKHNHIYHVMDAADFPMSFIPGLQNTLKLSAMRSQNRRSKHKQWSHGRVADISFIITRADLLAPLKEQVDALMPRLVEILRDALGRSAQNVRLGNVRCVSAKRGWWTKKVKEEIWARGGAAWIVGKINVGKSNLFGVVFPKGRDKDSEHNLDKLRHETKLAALGDGSPDPESHGFVLDGESEAEISAKLAENDTMDHDPDSLLPPSQQETPYPVMPIVSDLAGTTAAPIRVPFGNGKGELIDLPGLARGGLEGFVKPEHRQRMIMKQREAPEKIVMKSHQSLLLGGLIRITPTTPDLIFLVHPFVPLTTHLTSTEKAIEIQARRDTRNVPVITEDWAGEHMKSAGKFQLKWDVTKEQTGTLTARDAGKRKPRDLPFIVYATDILIEGVGWIEVSCQVRKRALEAMQEAAEQPASALLGVGFEDNIEPPVPVLPEIEVFSPEGKYVASRRTLNGSVLGGKKKIAKHLRKARPRRSMKFMKSLKANQPSKVED